MSVEVLCGGLVPVLRIPGGWWWQLGSGWGGRGVRC